MGWQNILRNVVKELKDTVKETVQELDQNKQAKPSQAAAQPSSKPWQQAPAVESVDPRYAEPVDRTDVEWVAYFREILQTAFPQYTFRENVPVTELAGYVSDEFQLYSTRPRQVYQAEWGKPYSFVMYQAGMPRGIVMLGKGHSHDSNVKYLIARKYAQKMNLPYINFYTQMTNERNYVIERIHKFGV